MEISIYSKEIQGIGKQYLGNLYSQILGDPRIKWQTHMHNVTYKNLHQKDIRKTSRCAVSKENEAIIKSLPTKNTLSRY